MTLYLIDFETTFSKDHTLTKHSIEEYVRHPKFEVIGLGILAPGLGQGDWMTHPQEMAEWLEVVCTTEATSFACHHAQFDGFILSQVFGLAPPLWLDTLSMSRAVYPRLEKHSLDALAASLFLGSPKTVPYNEFRGLTADQVHENKPLCQRIGDGCLHDLELTHNLLKILLPQMPDSELDLIDETIRLYTEPLLVGDKPLLSEALTEAVIARESKMVELGLTDNVLRSRDKLASLLLGAGLDRDELPTKISPRNGKRTYAFAKSDIEFLQLREHGNPLIRDIVEARIAAQTSIHETRAGRLLSTSERGAIPIYLKHYGAHTGRPSGGDKSNFTNLPRGSKLRRALQAPPSYSLVWADASQIECRTTAELSGCDTLIEAFKQGRDVYSEFGELAFDCEVSKLVNPDLRFFSKETVLGCGYGMGEEKFYKYLESKIANFEQPMDMLPRDETNRLIKMFRREYWEIPRAWKELDYFIGQMHKNSKFEGEFGPVKFKGQKVLLPNGMFLDYTSLRWVNKGEPLTERLESKKDGYYIGASSLWGGSILENIIQALARIMISDVWLDMAKLNMGQRCVLWVYDELVFAVPLKFVEQFKSKLGERMRQAPTWMPGIPLDCELGSGQAYGK